MIAVITGTGHLPRKAEKTRPMTNEPVRFTTRVAIGNVEAAKASPTAYLSIDPNAPPKPTHRNRIATSTLDGTS